jgi:Tfp pilus assembly protein PilF
MTHTKIILIAATAIAILSLAGCGESSNRVSSAQRRWDRVMEKARIEAAQQSIEQGRLEYGVRLLEDLIESDSVFAGQARQILAELKAAKQEIAQARASTSTNVKL